MGCIDGIIKAGSRCSDCICGIVNTLAGKVMCAKSKRIRVTRDLHEGKRLPMVSRKQLQVDWLTMQAIKDFNEDCKVFGECCVNTSEYAFVIF